MNKALSVQTIYGDFSLDGAAAAKTPSKKLRLTKPTAKRVEFGENNDDDFFLHDDELMAADGEHFFAAFEPLADRLMPIETEKHQWAQLKARIRRLQQTAERVAQLQRELATGQEKVAEQRVHFDSERVRVEQLIVAEHRGRDYAKELQQYTAAREQYRQQLLAERNAVPKPDAVVPHPAKLVDGMIASRLFSMERARWRMLLSHLDTAALLWQAVHDQGRYAVCFADRPDGYTVYVRWKAMDPAERHYIVIRSDLLCDSATGVQ